jgi:hypothetical protein
LQAKYYGSVDLEMLIQVFWCFYREIR